MTDTDTQAAWADNTLTENQQRNRESAALIPVTRTGAIPMNFAQMVDYAKFMSTARGAVGAHLMGNVGACLAVMEIANQFGLPAYAVARQSYLVNNRVAFMGQFFHTIVEDFGPLEKGKNGRKLQFRYEGEGDTLKIIVSATFKGALEPVVYESPEIAKIPVKNSPLWKTEPRRQLIYFGVRGWQTINWPEGMMHALSEDEAMALPPSEYARDITPIASAESAGLKERLAAAQAEHPPGAEREGFRDGFTEGHFTETVAQTDAAIDEAVAGASGQAAPDPVEVEEPAPAKPKGKAKPDKKKKAKAFPGDTPIADKPTAEALPPPKTAAQWVVYCRTWLEAETDPNAMRKRWAAEQKMRNDVGVTSEERDPVFTYYQDRLTELEPE